MAARILKGRHCVICGKPGGTGFAAALASLKAEALEQGAPMNWRTLETADGKAHNTCIHREQSRLRRRRYAVERERERQAKIDAGTYELPPPLPAETVDALRRGPRPFEQAKRKR